MALAVVNNFLLPDAIRLQSQGDWTCSQSVHKRHLLISLWTRIHCRNPEVRYDVRSSLKEQRRAVIDERKLSNVSRIIPGDWGKAESGWLAWPLLRLCRKAQRSEAEFTSSSGSVRALSVTRKRNL